MHETINITGDTCFSALMVRAGAKWRVFFHSKGKHFRPFFATYKNRDEASVVACRWASTGQYEGIVK